MRLRHQPRPPRSPRRTGGRRSGVALRGGRGTTKVGHAQPEVRGLRRGTSQSPIDIAEADAGTEALDGEAGAIAGRAPDRAPRARGRRHQQRPHHPDQLCRWRHADHRRRHATHSCSTTSTTRASTPSRAGTSRWRCTWCTSRPAASWPWLACSSRRARTTRRSTRSGTTCRQQKGVETHYPHVDSRRRRAAACEALVVPLRWLADDAAVLGGRAVDRDDDADPAVGRADRAFTAIIHDNNRPTQPLNGRPVVTEPVVVASR